MCFDSHDLNIETDKCITLLGGSTERTPVVAYEKDDVEGFDGFGFVLTGGVSKTLLSSKADIQHIPGVIIKTND